MKITLEEYEHTCHDGCCTTWGYDIFVDGHRIGHIEGDDVNLLVRLVNTWVSSLPKERNE